MKIRPVHPNDAKQITDIYNGYIENSVATFEEDIISGDEMLSRITNVSQLGHNWLVAQQNNTIIGYAYSSLFKERSAYRYASEITVYLAKDAIGKGVGKQLYTELFKQLEHSSICSVISVITLPNDASVALHESFGMKKVAHFDCIGYKFGQWHSVGYWQKILKTEITS